ncbi:hypothetical protein SDC9_146575 [bioreactor metagenome]|uniref:Uncharacterized protein n=1 Tax=bioreactor metagenome TaxID=1076179 RepID=A0A645EBG5_9ZZZZ
MARRFRVGLVVERRQPRVVIVSDGLRVFRQDLLLFRGPDGVGRADLRDILRNGVYFVGERANVLMDVWRQGQHFFHLLLRDAARAGVGHRERGGDAVRRYE